MLIVETTGQFGLLTPNGQDVHYDRPTVLERSQFTEHQASLGRIRILRTDVPDGANDTDFQKFYDDSKGDKELAIESYISSFHAEQEELDLEPVKPKPRRKSH